VTPLYNFWANRTKIAPSKCSSVVLFEIFEASVFVASYHSQGHGGGIRPRIHTGFCLNLICSSLCSLDSDGIENSFRNSSYIVSSCSYCSGRVENTIPVIVYGHYLAMTVVWRVIIYQRVYFLQYLKLIICIMTVSLDIKVIVTFYNKTLCFHRHKSCRADYCESNGSKLYSIHV
jgi:hypothetical protein